MLNYKNVSARVCMYGDLGSGKTLCAVREAEIYHFFYPKNPIYSNIHIINVPFKIKELDSPRILFEINQPCFMLLDEWWHVADSHKRGLVNDMQSMIMLRSRKKNWHVAVTEQYYTQLDLRIRFSTDFWVEPSHNEQTDRITMQFYSKHGTPLRRKRFNSRPFYSHYDSTEDPLTLDVEELKTEYEAYMNRRRMGLSGIRR